MWRGVPVVVIWLCMVAEGCVVMAALNAPLRGAYVVLVVLAATGLVGAVLAILAALDRVLGRRTSAG